MLYNGHLVIAGNFLRNRPNHSQMLKEKPLHNGHFYSGHLFRAPREHFGQNLPLDSGHPMVVWEKENTCMFLFDAFFHFNMKLII